MKKLFITITLLVAIIACAHAQQYTQKASMPTKRSDICAAHVNGKVYVFGGRDQNGILDKTEEYDPATDSWMTKASMPHGVRDAAASAVNGKIYITGGYNDIIGASNYTQEYDPLTDTWALKANMPMKMTLISGVAIGGKIYVPSARRTDIYDPAADKWSSHTWSLMGNADVRQVNGVAALGNSLFVIGGGDVIGLTDCFSTAYEYDSYLDNWRSVPTMPVRRMAGAAVSYRGRIHYFGGSTDFWGGINTIYNNCFDNNYIYDKITDAWSIGAAMPMALVGHIAVAVDDKIYIGGGQDNMGNPIDGFWQYRDTTTSPICYPAYSVYSNITLTSVDVSWEPVKGAIGYEYGIDLYWATNPPVTTYTTNTSVSFAGLSPNSYRVFLRAVCAPGDTSDWTEEPFFAKTNVSVNSVEGKGEFITVFPNPVNNVLGIKANSYPESNNRLIIRSISGNILRSISITEQETKIDVSDLSSGLYVLEYVDGERRQVMKLTKL